MNYKELLKKLGFDDGEMPSGFQNPSQQEEGLREPAIDPIAVLTPMAIAGAGKLVSQGAKLGTEMLTSPYGKQLLAEEVGSVGPSIKDAAKKAAQMKLKNDAVKKDLVEEIDPEKVKSLFNSNISKNESTRLSDPRKYSGPHGMSKDEIDAFNAKQRAISQELKNKKRN